jgi:hypothetical protein
MRPTPWADRTITNVSGSSGGCRHLHRRDLKRVAKADREDGEAKMRSARGRYAGTRNERQLELPRSSRRYAQLFPGFGVLPCRSPVKVAMPRPPATFALLALLLATPLAGIGQNAGQNAQTARDQQQPLSWVPQGFEVMGRQAAFHTDFTFDRSMVQMAGYFIGDADRETREAIAKLNGISVHSYHFASSGLYDPSALDMIRRQYEAAGWRHLVTAHAKGDPFDAGQTDLWINFSHMDVTGMVVLFSGPKDLNLIALNGDLSPLDLLHLRGHFGIPRFSGDRFVPSPGSRARQPYVAPAPQAPIMSDQAPAAGIGVGSPEIEAAPPPPTPPGF